MTTPFADRRAAGRHLAKALQHMAAPDVVVVGLPRGGVPVAYEVATALGAPLDVIVVRKLGVPFQPELGMGAIGEGGTRAINEEIVRMARVSEQELADVERRERAEVEQRARKFHGDREPVPLAGRTVIVVDDGVATGSTARAACQIARAHGAAKVILAVPVAPMGVQRSMQPDADEAVCLHAPFDFIGIGEFYDDFSQTSDEEVIGLLSVARGEQSQPTSALADPLPDQEDVVVVAGPVQLAGLLRVPASPRGFVAFAHGSGSSRHSPRNRYVAAELNRAGFGTLLFDLLTVEEEADRRNVFDIDLLAQRLLDVTAWMRNCPQLSGVQIGYFGASTGAAAALRAAIATSSDVQAIVSRGGRPDLAGADLGLVRAPTLLIVGGRDDIVIELNRRAQAQLRCENKLEIVPRATHLFDEPGTLEVVARLAIEWFTAHLESRAPALRPRDRPGRKPRVG